MKNYEKPRLMVLSLAGNERLCGDCADKNGLLLSDPNNSFYAEQILIAAGQDGAAKDGIQREDFQNVFDVGDCQLEVSTYCKFNSARTVAWS